MNGAFNPADLVNYINIETGLLLLKWLYVILFGLYLVFALVVLTQIRQMLASLNGELDKAIIVIGWIHVGLAVTALIGAIVIL